MPSLQDLPSEILLRIIESFCLHCTPIPVLQCRSGCLAVSSHCCHRGVAYRCAIEDSSFVLAALCLTSRHLHNLTIRPLYHRPCTKNWWLLARTLLSRPDLASHVKHLCFPEFFEYPDSLSDVPDTVLSYYKTNVDAYAATLRPHDADEFWRLLAMDDPLVDGNTNYPMTILTSLCPAVEHVEGVMMYGAAFEFCKPGSMPKLKTLEVVHYDTEGGIAMSNYQGLFKAAPGLEVVRGNALAFGEEDEEEEEEQGEEEERRPREQVRLEAVREVEFQYTAMGAGELRGLLKACPGMETFVYMGGGMLVGYEQFTPDEARDIILENPGKLKRVKMDMEMADLSFAENWNGWSDNDIKVAVEAFREKGIEFEIVGL